MTTTPTPTDYPTLYCFMSYADYLLKEAAGTLDDGTISTAREVTA